MKRGLLTYPDPPEDIETEPAENLRSAHFDTLDAVYDWWQILPFFDTETGEKKGYQISVSLNRKRGECAGETVIGVINKALKLEAKLQ